MKIAIVTDSTANLTEDECKAWGISVVPLYLNMGSASYLDGVEMSAAAFYQRMKDEETLPTTSQPSPGQFVETFERLLTTHDCVVAVLLSGKLSGTVHSAETARGLLCASRIHVIDSQVVEYALGALVLEMAKAVRRAEEQGDVCDVQALIGRMERQRASMHMYIAMNSLENLRLGGRIGAAAALLGSMMQIKPVIWLRDGQVGVFEKVRTYRRAVDSIMDRLVEQMRDAGPCEVMLIHSVTDLDVVRGFVDKVQAALPEASVSYRMLAPIVGVHVGFESLGAIYYARTAAQ